MKHEEFNLRYNEVMFDEAEMIVDFLRRQADVKYGNQMFEWYITPSVELIEHSGVKVQASMVFLKDGNLFIEARDEAGETHELDYCVFAYNEMSKILDVLPEPDSIVDKQLDEELKRLCLNYNMNKLLEVNPFDWRDKRSKYTVLDVFLDEENKLNYEIHEEINGADGGFGVWESIELVMKELLVKRMKNAVLKSSQQFNTLKRQLNWFGGNLYNFVENGNAGSVYITPRGTDLQLAVLDVNFDDGRLNILVSVAGTRIAEQTGEDTMYLTEDMIEPQYLDGLISFFNGNHFVSESERQTLADSFTSSTLNTMFGERFSKLDSIEDDAEINALWEDLNQKFYNAMESVSK